MLDTILTKGLPVKIINKEWSFFYGYFELATTDGRICMWDSQLEDYIYIPITDIVTIEFFPQKYLTQERKEVNE